MAPASRRPIRPSDEDLNPHREEELRRATEHTLNVLRQRGIPLSDDEDPEELADLLSAVERFEKAAAALGADSFVNTPGSPEPEDPALVLPVREPGEPLMDYIRRIHLAADALAQLRS